MHWNVDNIHRTFSILLHDTSRDTGIATADCTGDSILWLLGRMSGCILTEFVHTDFFFPQSIDINQKTGKIPYLSRSDNTMNQALRFLSILSSLILIKFSKEEEYSG